MLKKYMNKGIIDGVSNEYSNSAAGRELEIFLNVLDDYFHIRILPAHAK